MPLDLSSKQRKALRGLAHDLEPVVHVGKGGATAEVVAQVGRMLEIHELIKVRFVGARDEKDEVLATLAAATGAAEAGRVGHVGILYKPQPDPEKRKIRI
jgi:RNA-binding protein